MGSLEHGDDEERGIRARAAAALAWGWRLFLRGVGFAEYVFTAWILGIAIIPVVRLYGRLRGWSADELDVAGQRGIHLTTVIHLRFAEWLGVARITAVGAERLGPRPRLIVANHPSLYDTPVLTRFLPQADFIVSSEWTGSFFFRGAIRGGGYLSAERGALAVRRAIERLRGGRSLVVYPEGSRSLPEGLRPFQRGAALIALRSGFDVVPVVIRVTPRTLMKGQSILDMPPECPEWRVEVGEPIGVKDYLRPGETNSQAARRLTAELQDYFEKRWDRASSR